MWHVGNRLTTQSSVTSYLYDAANRLTTRPQLSDPHPVAFYRYNGLGDRLQDGFYGGSRPPSPLRKYLH